MHYTQRPLCELGDMTSGIEAAGLRNLSAGVYVPTVLGVTPQMTVAEARHDLGKLFAGKWECDSRHHMSWQSTYTGTICDGDIRHNNAFCSHGALVGLRKAICASTVLQLLKLQDARNIVVHAEMLQVRMNQHGDNQLIKLSSYKEYPAMRPADLDMTTLTPAYMEGLGHRAKETYGQPIQDLVERFHGIFQRAPDLPDERAFREESSPHMKQLLQEMTQRHNELFPVPRTQAHRSSGFGAKSEVKR